MEHFLRWPEKADTRKGGILIRKGQNEKEEKKKKKEKEGGGGNGGKEERGIRRSQGVREGGVAV